MARVAIVHNTLDFRGGADAVALAACEALDRDHEVELITASVTSLETIASQFGRQVSVPVRQPYGGRSLANVMATIESGVGPQLAIRSALVRTLLRGGEGPYDLVVSTTNELAIEGPSVQYIHVPQFNRHRIDDGSVINRVASHFAAPTTDHLEHAVLLANSEWTADAIEQVYGVEATVLYPPVPTDFETHSWSARNDGVVLLGRIAPDRRVLEAIDIIDRVRDRGANLDLTIVGTAGPSYRRYLRRVRTAVENRSYVTLDVDASRDRVCTHLAKNRYGLNVRRDESFGIAVAEYVAAGMLVFAPNTAGQREILDETDHYLFDSLEEAANKITTAVERDHRPSETSHPFGWERFTREFSAYVEATLEAV